MRKDMKVFDFVVSRLLDVLLIATIAVWVIGVDAYPILQWIGLPMLFIVFFVWAVFSDSLVRIIEWCGKHIEEGDDDSK